MAMPKTMTIEITIADKALVVSVLRGFAAIMEETAGVVLPSGEVVSWTKAIERWAPKLSTFDNFSSEVD